AAKSSTRKCARTAPRHFDLWPRIRERLLWSDRERPRERPGHSAVTGTRSLFLVFPQFRGTQAARQQRILFRFTLTQKQIARQFIEQCGGAPVPKLQNRGRAAAVENGLDDFLPAGCCGRVEHVFAEGGAKTSLS